MSRGGSACASKILAIDPANLLGFAHSDGWRGVYRISRPTDRHPGQRLERFQIWLNQALASHPCDLIAAEDASFGSPNRAVQAQHNELRGIIFLSAWTHDIEVAMFSPTAIKAFATGSGRAPKEQMVAACRLMLGIDPRDDNEADALWILQMAGRPDCWPSKRHPKQKTRGQQWRKTRKR